MQLTDELQGEILKLGPDERLIISLPENAARDDDWPATFTREVAKLIGFDRVLVVVGADGAATIPQGARLTDAEYVALNGFVGGAEARRILTKGHQTEKDGEALLILRTLLDVERAVRETEA